MIEIINDKLVFIDSNENMTEMPKLSILYNSMKVMLDCVIIDENLIKPTEDIYDYIVEKIYLMPEYAHEMSFVSFNDNPKEKILIAFNKFIFNKMEEHENIGSNTD
jgi:hypothetical protein